MTGYLLAGGARDLEEAKAIASQTFAEPFSNVCRNRLGRADQLTPEAVRADPAGAPRQLVHFNHEQRRLTPDNEL